MTAFPQALTRAIDALTNACDRGALTRDAQAISENYRLRTGQGARLLTRESEAAAYAAARMPATYAAAYAALAWTLEASGLAPATLLDCGAGTGAVSWAAAQQLWLTQITCLEREDAMRAVGSRLMQAGEGALSAAQWANWDLGGATALPQAELVCEGYMLGELPQALRLPAAQRIWDAAKQLALFIEPGTPQGFATLRAVRELLTAQGAHVAAPCPAALNACPMAGEDWCHFAVRVQRSQLHKALKGGDAPYEDEKFCYLALMREPPHAACTARVLRHPQIAPGRIGLALCTNQGLAPRTVTKKDPLWKQVRKIRAGDALL